MNDHIMTAILITLTLACFLLAFKILRKIKDLLCSMFSFSSKRHKDGDIFLENASNKNNKQNITFKSYKNCITDEILEEEEKQRKKRGKIRIFLTNPIGFFTQLIFNEKADMLNLMMNSEEYDPDKHFEFMVKSQNALKHNRNQSNQNGKW